MDHRYGDSSRPVDSVLGSSLYDLEKLASQFWKKIENNLHEIMKLVEIKPDEVFLKPALIKKQRR